MTCGRAAELPTMSLSSIPAMSTPLRFATLTKCVDPNRPCSSPATAMKTIVASNLSGAMTRASSSEVATPLASSSAPGAKHVVLKLSVHRES